MARDLGEHVSKSVGSTLSKLANPIFMIVIHWVLNVNNRVVAPKLVEASNTNVSHIEELIMFGNKSGGLNAQ